MIVFSVEPDQLSFEIVADGSQDRAQVVQNGFCKHATAVFGDKDQVNMQIKYAVSSGSDII